MEERTQEERVDLGTKLADRSQKIIDSAGESGREPEPEPDTTSDKASYSNSNEVPRLESDAASDIGQDMDSAEASRGASNDTSEKASESSPGTSTDSSPLDPPKKKRRSKRKKEEKEIAKGVENIKVKDPDDAVVMSDSPRPMARSRSAKKSPGQDSTTMAPLDREDFPLFEEGLTDTEGPLPYPPVKKRQRR